MILAVDRKLPVGKIVTSHILTDGKGNKHIDKPMFVLREVSFYDYLNFVSNHPDVDMNDLETKWDIMRAENEAVAFYEVSID